MRKKFKIIICLLFIISINLLAIDNKIIISFIRQKIDYNIKFDVAMKYLIDLAETGILEKYDNITIKNLMGDIENYELNETQKVIINNGVGFYYFITTNINENNLVFNIQLYNWQGKVLNDGIYNLSISKKNNLILTTEKEKEWLDLIYNLLNANLNKSEKVSSEKIKTKINYKYDHDFPLIGITISALSVKMYFDERINSKIQKIFSLSPIDLRLSFYPLRYMETGLFCRFDFSNMVYNYFDKNANKNKYFDTSLLVSYGIFLGASFFKENIHFSFGFQIYNMYYDVQSFPKFNKRDDINSYFLPQFAIYYKMDFRLIKYLHFSIFLNFKTLPKFEYYNGYLYSKPFYYDFFCLEFTFAGISVMF
jgi:hypothetical protein